MVSVVSRHFSRPLRMARRYSESNSTHDLPEQQGKPPETTVAPSGRHVANAPASDEVLGEATTVGEGTDDGADEAGELGAGTTLGVDEDDGDGEPPPLPPLPPLPFPDPSSVESSPVPSSPPVPSSKVPSSAPPPPPPP